MKPTEKLHQLGQSLWLDNITREMLDSGQLREHIELRSVTGLTSNPTIFDKAIQNSDAYDDDIADASRRGATPDQVFFELAIKDLQRAADLFAPVHERSGGVDGYVSLEVSPLLADDSGETIKAAKELHSRADRPNLYIKIPGTKEGLRAIEESVFSGVPVNVTLLFSADQYQAAADAYMKGLERRVEQGLSPVVASVASIFVSRWDKAANERLPEELHQKLGIAAAARAYQAYRELLDSDRWQRLANFGARPQRLLFASTSTKDPKAKDTLYVTALAAPFTINTMPDETLTAFFDHGEVSGSLSPAGEEADRMLQQIGAAGIDLEELADQLQDEGKESFDASWRDLLDCIKGKVSQLAEAR